MNSNFINLKKADFKYWNKISNVTLNEFIYLAAGCNPEKFGLNKYADNLTFIEYYDKVLRYTKDSFNFQVKKISVHNGEVLYLALDLINWAKSLGIKVNSLYKPKKIFVSDSDCLSTTQSNHDLTIDDQKDGDKSKLNLEAEFITKLRESGLYEYILWAQKKFYSGEVTYLAKNVLKEIIEFNTDRKNNSKNHLSINHCELIHNLLRVVNGFKKT